MYLAVFGDKLPIMTDYKTFFGLSKAPFAALAAGTDVFIAPQVASAMAGIKKALASEDAVIAVSGPVGSGKTTITRRALESAAEFHIIVTIGRIQFGHDEVLELLLAGLGVRQLPKSTVHRFATFRRVLQQYAEQKTRVFILIEDATRVGLDALSELEAVTAADAGVSNGANLILLGDGRLNALLKDPTLARIKQRVRIRQVVAAQTSNELHGYLKHCFRLAGKEFDEIFDAEAAATLHRLTDGIPRVVNNLVVATLGAAAESGQRQVGTGLIEKIADVEFGLTGGHKVAEIEAAIEKAAEPEPQPEPEPVLQAVPEPEPEPLLQAEPEPEIAAAAADIEDDEDEIPELIQDTLPDLQILAPQLLPDEEIDNAADTNVEIAAEPEADVPELKPEPVHEPTEFELPILTGEFPELAADTAAEPEPEQLPELKPEPVVELQPEPEPIAKVEPEPEPEPEPQAEASASAADDSAEVPAWERDPTLAQLRPDLDALERAMHAAQGDDDNSRPKSVIEENLAQEPEPAPQPVAAAPEPVLEITLDKQIQAKIEEATEALKQTQVDATAELGGDAENAAAQPSKTATSDVAEPAITLDASVNGAAKADQELEKIASELAKAKTLEDVDDMAAETLFGEEFSMMAAQVAANAPPIENETQVATGTPAGETNESLALSLEEEAPAAEESAAEAAPEPEQLDTSSSQRLQVLRDMNNTAPPPGAPPIPEASESIVMSGGGVELPPAENSDSVDSIEDQINISMTQNLKALNINHLPQNLDGDDDDETVEKTGFFGLFRRK